MSAKQSQPDVEDYSHPDSDVSQERQEATAWLEAHFEAQLACYEARRAKA